MLENTRLRGYVLAFISTIAMSNVYIFSKAALKEVELVQFGFYWYGFAILWNIFYAVPAKRYKTIWQLKPSSYRALLIIGILELIATTLFFLAINIVDNPAIVSFLANMTPIFVTAFGVMFLKERFSLLEAIGFILTISGAFILSYKKSDAFSNLFLHGTGYIILSSLIGSVAYIVAKKYIRNIDPGIMAINRVVFLFTFSAIFLTVNGVSLSISWKGLYNIMLGSLLGPFLTAFTQYSALQYIEASRASIIQSSKGILVLLGALIYFGIFPLSYQVIGGAVTILGVILITGGKKIFRKHRSEFRFKR
jgi:drug/metabolite transporter (DMT)-like permease